MCVAGKNTGAMRDWAMSTKVDTSRSRWRATSISGLWPDTLSATRCAPISSWERRNGGGQACGNAVILREKSGRCWRRGRSICQRIGSSGSIKPTTRRNWKRFVGVCNEAAPLASRNGRRKSRNVWASSRPIVPRVAREGWAEIKMPRPGEDRSDVGGAAQFNNIGPVPLSPSRFNIRGDPRRGSEENRQEDRGRDFAFGLEVQVRLAEVAGEAVDLGGCQGGSGLAHSSLQKTWNWRKLVWETCLSLPSPATPLTRKFGIY